jgi:hypothetical protein
MSTTTSDRSPYRWEWRTFASSLADLEAKIAAVADVPVHESREVYLLGARDDLNLKLRNGTLDLKCLEETDANGRAEPNCLVSGAAVVPDYVSTAERPSGHEGVRMPYPANPARAR